MRPFTIFLPNPQRPLFFLETLCWTMTGTGRRSRVCWPMRIALSPSTEFEDVRGSREIVRETIANARQSCIDLVRRRRTLSLTLGEQTALQQTLDVLRARLRFFDASV